MSGVILLMTSPIDLPVSLRRGPHFTLAVLLAALFVAGGAGAAEQTARLFNLSADTAAKTLRQFTEQSGIPVVFGTATATQVRTNAVQGEFTPTEAMARLLADTGLVVTANEKTGALTVSRDPNAQRAAPVATGSRPNTPSAAEVRDVAGDAAITLSPFMVSTDKDAGYAATETLAGTRMRTNLRDVGASLAVLTPEFFEDLGVTSVDRALIFTPSVDTYQGDNDAGFNSTSNRFFSGQQVSLRGFVAGPSASHDFFSALERNDTYNTERITLSRGPNAMLFGLGGSAGTFVNTTKRASLTGDKKQLILQFDRWGSKRAGLDVNQSLVKDRLALRVNLLKSQKREFRQYEGVEQERGTLGLSWRPFKDTEIIVNHETYKTGSNLSPLVKPFEVGVLQWVQAGKPTVDFTSQGTLWTAAGRTFLDAKGNPIGSVSGTGFVTNRAGFDPKNSLVQTNVPSFTWIVGLDRANPMVNTRYQATLQNSTFAGVVGNNGRYNLLDADPWNLFGLPKDANLYPGTWDDPARQNRGHWTQVTIEQKIARGLYIEIAANHARDNIITSTESNSAITFDVNRYMPDGTPNPGYLVPYNEIAGQYREGWTIVQQYRGTISYAIDLEKIHQWLGKQSFSALAQADKTDDQQDIMQFFNLATPGLSGYNTDALNAQHNLNKRVYFINGVVPYPLPDHLQVRKRLAELNSYGFFEGATPADRAPVNFALRPFVNARKSRNTDNSLSAAWLGRFFGDRLVTAMGIRRDDVAIYGVPASRSTVDPAVRDSATNPLRRYYDQVAIVPLDGTPTKTAMADNRTMGAVFRVTPRMELFYSKSRNFTPNVNPQSSNYLEQSIPDKAGKTADYGIRWSVLDERLSLSLNRFTTSAQNETRNVGSYAGGARQILTRLRTNYKDAGDSHFVSMAAANIYRVEVNSGLDSTWNYEAHGYELTAVFNPNPNWRIYLSGSDNANVTGAHLLDLGEYLNTNANYQGLGTWAGYVTELRKVAVGQASNFFDLNPNNAADRSKAAADATFIETQAATIQRVNADDQKLTGLQSNRNGRYALNGLVTHSFSSHGWLKGCALGGNFRWRSASIVGYERTLDANGRPFGVLDVARPIKGEDFWDLGLMASYRFRFANKGGVKFQLNVDNPLNWSRARLVSVEYDTQGYYGMSDAIVPVRYELRRPRNCSLTVTYDF